MRLRLFEQILGAGAGLDGVDHDADRLGELIQEHLVGLTERTERGQLHHALDLPLEQNRQDNDIMRLGLAQTRRDAEIMFGHIGKQDFLAFDGTLTDQAFAQLVNVIMIIREGISGQQSQAGFFAHGGRRLLLCRVNDIENRLLGRDHRRQFRQDEFAHRQQIFLPLEHA